VFAIGIDQSANHTGVAVLSLTGELKLLRLIEPKERGTARLVKIRDTLRDYLLPYKGAAVGVWESYSLQSTNMSFLLGEIGCMAQLALYDAVGENVHGCPPTVLKKFVSNNAHADKAAMKDAVHMRWGLKLDDDNLADAYGLARYGLGLLDPSSFRTRKQREALHTATRAKKKREKPFRLDRSGL
jgi:Holliday junction resolvasome RuvABC endonuclease subunit